MEMLQNNKPITYDELYAKVTKFIKKEEELDVINAAYGFALEKHGNKVRRKRNLQQAMKESFFYGANRFGNNFIA